MQPLGRAYTYQAVGTVGILRYMLSSLQCLIRVRVGVEGVPTLSRFSESPSCWYLRVTLTPERPSYNSCIVHLLHPAH